MSMPPWHVHVLSSQQRGQIAHAFWLQVADKARAPRRQILVAFAHANRQMQIVTSFMMPASINCPEVLDARDPGAVKLDWRMLLTRRSVRRNHQWKFSQIFHPFIRRRRSYLPRHMLCDLIR